MRKGIRFGTGTTRSKTVRPRGRQGTGTARADSEGQAESLAGQVGKSGEWATRGQVFFVQRSSLNGLLQHCARVECAKWKSRMSAPACGRSNATNIDAGCGRCIPRSSAGPPLENRSKREAYKLSASKRIAGLQEEQHTPLRCYLGIRSIWRY